MRDSRLTLALWLAWLTFVVYGSLVPLDYRPLPFEQALAAFRNIPFLQLGLESRADWVANGVLYWPLGYLSATLLIDTFHRRVWVLPAMLLAALFCIAVAIAVEFTQLFFPPRTVSLNDLWAEGIGSMLGVAAAPMLLPWLRRFQQQIRLGGRGLARHLLSIYAAAYLLLCFFPYDLLLSAEELAGKLASDSWGWWMAASAPRPAIAILQFALEIVMAMPFGWLLARGRAGGGEKSAGAQARSALALGALLGLAIEFGQIWVATGVSQGVSVLSRSLGVLLGSLLWRARARLNGEAVAGLLRRFWHFPVLAYGLALALVNGLFLYRWHGLEGALAHWPEVQLLPFYYHYYTSEALALFSLGTVALSYLPLVALAWAGNWSGRLLALVAGLSSLVMETSKLFLDGAHPDPTNILIALGACLLARQMLQLALTSNSTAPAEASEVAELAPRASTTAEPATDPASAGLLPALLTLGLVGAVFVWALRFPAFSLPLSLLLLACGLAVYWRPLLALVLLPAALPVLDLAPWSGRFYWDEFDLLLLLCLAIAGWRTRLQAGQSKAAVGWDMLSLGFVLLGLSLAISTVRALLPWHGLDLSAISGYSHPVNALRIVKGALAAWGLAWLYRRLALGASASAALRMLSLGMNAGLAMTVAFILWERLAFVDLLDFAADFRVTGPISAMHKGGAYIECWLAVAAGFTLLTLLQAGSWAARVAPALLLLAASYAMAVTYSRNGYAALAVVLVLMLLLGLTGHGAAGKTRLGRAGLALLLLGLVGAAAAPILVGGFARERLSQTAADLGVRRAHWQDALALRDGGLATELLGMGLGRFPDSHFWRSAEPLHAASYRVEQEEGNRFLRLGAGAAIYVEQIVSLEPGRDYRLSARVRSSLAHGAASASLCQKWMLTSTNCQSVPLAAGPTAGQWQGLELEIKASAMPAEPFWFARRPLKLALVTPGQKQVFDIDDVSLETDSGSSVLVNGDFAAGLDRWFFTTDIDPPWHIHSLPVAVLFDQGWFGVLAWSIVVGAALVIGLRRAWRGSAQAMVSVAAVAGFLVSGSLNTLIDAPRFLCLLLFILFLCRPLDRDPHLS